MSYILNALKKAERDRMREEPQDLDDFVSSGWDPYQEQTKNDGNYRVAVIIVLVAGLLFYGFYSLTNKPVIDPLPVSAVIGENRQQQITLEPQPAPLDEPVKLEPVKKEPLEEPLQLPELTIAGHIYIRSGSPKNRIFIGEKTYFVGDKIEGDWVIEAINFDSLNIRSGMLSSELPLR